MKKRRINALLAAVLAAALAAGCGQGNKPQYELNEKEKEASRQTTDYNESFYTLLDFE